MPKASRPWWFTHCQITMPGKGYTIHDVREGFREGRFTPREIAQTYAHTIQAHNPELNAYLSVFPNSSELDERSTSPSPLAGVPCALKDNLLVKGTVATAGSKILQNYISSYDATVVARLRSAGAVFMGKTNMDEFAMGSSTENSAFGPTRNPLDTTRVPGGSSGGSAAAVAADLCVFALGSDTGGSIRQPASFCGVVGLKPTYGRVSRHGLMAMASSLDQVGTFTKNVSDAASILSCIAGHDPLDATTADIPVPDYTASLSHDLKGMSVGVPKEYFGDGLDGEVRQQIEAAIDVCKDLGVTVVPISLPNSHYALAVYYIVMPCEVSVNLARFDGIRYGYSSSDADTLLEVYHRSRARGFGPEPKRRIMLGTHALSSGYFDAYYLKAQKVRALIKRDFDEAFRRVDAIIGPTSPSVAFKIGEKSSDPLAMYLSDIYTVPVNLAGLPALSVPCGVGGDSRMPVGLQIIGKPFDESGILRFAHHLEKRLQS